MALKIWLPLNGNLNNNGLYNCNITNNGASIDNYGKIGKCYSFDGNDDIIQMPYHAIFGGTHQFTYCCWIYDNNLNSRAVYLGDWSTGSGATNLNLAEKTSTNKLRFYWSANPDITKDTYEIPNQTWFHLAITYDGKNLSFYKNGILVGYNEVTLNTLNKTQGYFGIGRDGRTGTTAFNGKMNDFRLYDECLSDRQIKDIARGLCCHYKLDNIYDSDNLIANWDGKLGTLNWKYPDRTSTTEIPSGTGVSLSVYQNETLQYIPIFPNHTYGINVRWKAKTETGSGYVALYPYDIDKKLIEHYHTKIGFNSNYIAKLTQPLKPGDTVIHADNLSAWDDSDSYFYMVAIFGYKDSTGYVYPDLEYTHDTYAFGTKTDKTNLNKLNNTITLLRPFEGETRPIGTVIGQATQGAVAYYPLTVNVTNIPNWTLSSTKYFTPKLDDRLKWARYVKYSTLNSTTYQAVMTFTDVTLRKRKIITDSSGCGYDAPKVGSLYYNNLAAHYDGSIQFNNGYLHPIVSPLHSATDEFTISCWFYPTATSTMALINDRNTLGGGVSLFYLDQGLRFDTTQPGQWAINKSTAGIVLNQWNFITAVYKKGQFKKIYINGILKASQTITEYNLTTIGDIFSIGQSSTNQEISTNKLYGCLNDFRIYSTVLSDEDIKELYNTSAKIYKNNKVYAFEFKEE